MDKMSNTKVNNNGIYQSFLMKRSQQGLGEQGLPPENAWIPPWKSDKQFMENQVEENTRSGSANKITN